MNKKVTNKELLERIEKLEKKLDEISNNHYYPRVNLENNEDYFQPLDISSSTYGVDIQHIHNHYYCPKEEVEKLFLF